VAVVKDLTSSLKLGIESFIRFSERMNVDFPHPEGPMIAVTTFRWIRNVVPASARLAP